MELRIIKHGSSEYGEMIELRVKTLLEPIGIPAVEYADPEKEKNDIFIGSFEDDKLLGCCVLTHHNVNTLQLRQMAVKTGIQGKGIGAAIVVFAEEIARSKKYTKLMMHARDPVIGFYEKCGYAIAGDQFFEVGMGHHMMEKEL